MSLGKFNAVLQRHTMATQNLRYSKGRGMIYGIMGGIAGGIVMLAPMMAMMSMLGLPSDLFPTLVGMMTGQQIQNASAAGIGVHLLASISVGAIFETLISTVGKLQIGGFGKGISLGIVTGVIAFVVLFIPAMMSMAPQMMNLMKMMNPGMSDQSIMTQLQNMQPAIFAGSFLAHVIYGTVLGATTTLLIVRTGQKECRICRMHFKSKDEFLDHAIKHHGVATS